MNKDELGKDLGIDRADINAIRQRAVSEEFAENKDKRALILLGQYPF